MNPDLEQVLEQESKPVRDVLKANYGVVFNEEVQKGGKQNCRIAGMTYYDKPGRTMKREELKSRQEVERETKIKAMTSKSKDKTDDQGYLSLNITSG